MNQPVGNNVCEDKDPEMMGLRRDKETVNKKKTQKINPEGKKHRAYTVLEIIVILLIVVLTVSAVDGPGLNTWAENLDSSGARKFFTSMTEPLAQFSKENKLYQPVESATESFRKFVATGFAMEEAEVCTIPDLDVLYECSSLTIPEMSGYRSEIFTYNKNNPLRLLLVGDSLANCFKQALRPFLGDTPEIEGSLYGIQSTNLSNLTYGDWLVKSEVILEEEGDFDLVLIMLGTNSAQMIVTNQGEVYWDTVEWNRIYRERASRLIHSFTDKGSLVYWIGIPPMRLEGYKDRMVRENMILSEICSENNAVFIPIKEVIGDEEGLYTTYKIVDGVQTRIRTEDGIHYTREGSGLVLDQIVGRIQSDFPIALSLEED